MWHVILLMGTTFTAAVDAQDFSCQTVGGSPGSCVPINQCPEQLKLLQQARDPSLTSTIRILRRSICELSPRIRVCCAASQNPRVVLPLKCGVSDLEDRIVNGSNAGLLDWPWMALLRGGGSRGSNWICGGVLISERYVLTAAHCVHSSSGRTLEFVRIGEHTLSKNVDCEKGVCAPQPQDITVEDIKIHEGFGGIPACPRCHDIALLRLSRPAELHPLHVLPICLATNLEEDLQIRSRADFISKLAWVAGWGTIDPRRLKIPDVLQDVLLPISDEYCGSQLSVYPDPDMVLCAGGERKDSCHGDSGGPLILRNNKHKKFVVGIVSQGPVICGAERTQGIYTSVSYYMPWILKNLRN